MLVGAWFATLILVMVVRGDHFLRLASATPQLAWEALAGYQTSHMVVKHLLVHIDAETLTTWK